jgi:hypothetical protein
MKMISEAKCGDNFKIDTVSLIKEFNDHVLLNICYQYTGDKNTNLSALTYYQGSNTGKWGYSEGIVRPGNDCTELRLSKSSLFAYSSDAIKISPYHSSCELMYKYQKFWTDGTDIKKEEKIPDNQLDTTIVDFSMRPSAKGKIYFNGESISKITHVNPQIDLRNFKTGRIKNPNISYENGTFEVFGLTEGRHSVGIEIDANINNPKTYPGDFEGATVFSVTKDKTAEFVLEPYQIINLIKPINNDKTLPKRNAKCEENDTYSGPITFEWLPIAKGIKYSYEIHKSKCLPVKFNNKLASGTTEDTKATLELDPNEPGYLYSFSIRAMSNNRRVGTLIVHDKSGYSYDYRFRVK